MSPFTDFLTTSPGNTEAGLRSSVEQIEGNRREGGSIIRLVVDEGRQAFRGSPLERYQGSIVNRFESESWDLAHLRPPTRSGGNRRLHFTVHGSTDVPLPHSVSEMFKVYITHKHQNGVRTVGRLAGILSLLRRLWDAILDRRSITAGGVDGFSWDTLTLSDLAQLEEDLLQEFGARNLREKIRAAHEFANFLQRPHRSIIPIWTYGLPPADTSRHRRRSNERLAEWRRSRLPGSYEIALLGDRFAKLIVHGQSHPSNQEDLEDRLMLSVVALFLASGPRLLECATLPVDCLRIEETPFGRSVLLCLNRLKTGHYVRCFQRLSPLGAKLALTAVAEILRITKSWRQVAQDLERHADRVVVRDESGQIRSPNEVVNTQEALRLLGLRSSLLTRRPELKPVRPGRGSTPAGYRVADIAGQLQKDREARGLKTSVWRDSRGRSQALSQSLLVVPVNFLSRSRDHHPVLMEGLSPQKIAGWVSGQGGYRSIFEGLQSEREEEPRVTSHQFRHLLHFLAKKKGMSDVLLAIWMGRQDPEKVKDYVHDAPAELAARRLGERIKRREIDTLLQDFMMTLPKGTRGVGLAAAERMELHTPIGKCKANFYVDPCADFGWCLAKKCSNRLVQRGNRSQLVQIQTTRERTEEQLNAFHERLDAGQELEPSNGELLKSVMDGWQVAEKKVQEGPPDGSFVQVFPDGEDGFVPLDEERMPPEW